MNVGELKKQLADMPDDWPVIMSRDSEGNNFNTLYEVVKSACLN